MVRVPGVNHLDVVKALQKAGFYVARQSKHIVMTDGHRVVTVPPPQSCQRLYARYDPARRRLERGAVPELAVNGAGSAGHKPKGPYARTTVVFRPLDRDRQMPLLLGSS